ncbi:unnamed protein product [Fraxinus pennsylvanica]|uniref:Uncharacterized protein n=1 Tax=Fraxinus pennsylvanica TaxID=56036 RepID=A0AAD1Z6M4_9LAMI|nr:unnamed protein product [Fraxinus pennsylvanica]
MGDRRPSFFSRLLSSKPASRRTTASRTTEPSRTNTTNPSSSPSPPADESSSANQTTTPATPSTAETQSAGNANTPSSTPPPASETRSAGQTTTITPTPTALPTAETQTAGNANTPSSTTPPASETRSAGQTTTITPTPTTLPTAETQTAEKETNLTTNAIPTTPPTAETQTAGQATTPSSTTLTTPLTDENQTQTPSQSKRNTTPAATMPTSSEAQMANQTTATSIGPTIKSQTSSPTRATVQPHVPSQPASPFRATTKSRSPPQTSSPSLVAPQSRVVPSSPSRLGSATPLTPQRTSQPQSSRSALRSPNQTSSPSTKGVEHTTKEISHPLSNSHDAPNTVSNGEEPKPATSEQEPLKIQSKAKVKSEIVEDSHNQTAFETTIKQNQMEVEPSKSSELGAAAISTVAQGPETDGATQKLDSSSIDGETKSLLESNANPEETKEVKEVIEETKCEANENRNNEGNDFQTAKSGSRAQTVEEASIINKSEQMHEEMQGAIGKKEILKTSLFNGKPTKTSSRPGNKSMRAPTHKFAQSSREQVPLYKDIKDDISTFVNRMAIGDPKNSLNDRPVSVITLAGENRGASMQLGSDSSKGEGAIHIHRGYKINPDESPEATIDGEGSWKGKKSEDAEGKEDQPIEAYVNNNTQGINNSIVFESSIAERNPGVHMIVTHAQKEPTMSTDEKRPLEVQKAEFNTIPSQKQTYEPNVRRRCLEGLFLESSDSDPENPEKPKRHGCRVGSKERSKYNTRDVL